MMTWLASHPGPAYVPAGDWPMASFVTVPAGADLMIDNARLLGQNPASCCVRLVGAGTRLYFRGNCLIGFPGRQPTQQQRVGVAEGAGICIGDPAGNPDTTPAAKALVASAWTIIADNLQIEGVGQDGIFGFRGSHHGLIDGFITALNTAQDSFHFEDRCHDIQLPAEKHAVGSGDDCFAVVSQLSNGYACARIDWGTRNYGSGQKNGRGAAVVGGIDITGGFHFDDTWAAAVYIAAELGTWNSFAPLRVTFDCYTRNANTSGTHPKPVIFYNAHTDETIQDVALTVDSLENPCWAKTGPGPVTGCTVNGAAV